jgi:hypothetical protein
MSIPASPATDADAPTEHERASIIVCVYPRVGRLVLNMNNYPYWLQFGMYYLLDWALRFMCTWLPLNLQAWDVFQESFLPSPIRYFVYWWCVLPKVAQVILRLPLLVPLDFGCWAVHMDVVVQTEDGNFWDFSRSFDTGVTCKRHKEEHSLTAMLKFEMPKATKFEPAITLQVLVDLTEQEKKVWYRLWGNNCQNHTFKICKLLGATDSKTFKAFYLKMRCDLRYKLVHPLPPQIP